MSIRCGTYNRYSSDKQKLTSIEDQRRVCERQAAALQGSILQEFVYVDIEVSGYGADRPAYAKLLHDIQQSPRPFDVLLVDDTSRLCRNQGELYHFLDIMKFRGIRFIAVSQGIDTTHEQARISLTFQGMMDEQYLVTLAHKTHEGVQGVIKRGLHGGGRCFGYTSVRIDENSTSARLKINEAEASVVRWIFEMYAAGMSLKGIAKALNREGIPTARPRAKKRYATWCPSAIRAMLRRELYIGRVVWNSSQFVKVPNSNKRVRRPRPESEWVIEEHPELRIVDQTLWERVQNRLTKIADVYGPWNRPGLRPRAATSPNLLTGFLKCGVCGANLIIVTGRGKKGRNRRYGCPQNCSRGACANNLRERADYIEERLFSQLQAAVLTPEVIEYALSEFERQLSASLSDLGGKLQRLRNRANHLKAELENLVGQLAACKNSPAVVEAINVRQRELDDISSQMLGTNQSSISSELSGIREFVTNRLGAIRQLMSVDPLRAKEELQKHVSSIHMVPQSDHYVGEGEWDLIAGYIGTNRSPTAANIRSVAGARFELATFGL